MIDEFLEMYKATIYCVAKDMYNCQKWHHDEGKLGDSVVRMADWEQLPQHIKDVWARMALTAQTGFKRSGL